VERKLTVRDVPVSGKRVLMRVDFNVPLTQTGDVADDTRIRAAIPTIRLLIEQRARIILCSHLGRPDGKPDRALSLRPIAAHLSRLLGQEVGFCEDCVGPSAEAAVERLGPGQIILLENLRFHPQEEANDPGFARALAALADIYVDDAFGTAHRAHASTEGVTHFLPAVAGLLMERELDFLGRVVGSAQRPYAAIIGGAKISGKLEVLENLVKVVDRLLIGGGMANTFLKAQGKDVGASLVEQNLIETANRLLSSGEAGSIRIELPVDAVIADAFAADAQRRTIDLAAESVPDGWRIMDIGPRTVESFSRAISDCRTVFWNGPMGVFEMEPFAAGTLGLARAIAALDAVSIVGGGDTDAAIEQAGVAERITHISTGGGASLEFVEGKALPGVVALQNATPANAGQVNEL
jgi:phosphoglycerate kinase